MSRRPSPRASAGGFTIIELLVVIAIIGILTSIAIPMLLGSREKARTAGCEENLGALIPELQLRLDDHLGRGDASAAELAVDDVVAGHAAPISHNPRNLAEDAYVDAGSCGSSVPTPDTTCQVFLCHDGDDAVLQQQYDAGIFRTFRVTIE